MADVARKGGVQQQGGNRFVKPILPSADPMKQKVAKLREEIDRNNERIKQIKMVVDERRLAGRGRSESQELLAKLGTVRGEITRCLNKKNAIREQLEVQERTKKAMKSQVEAAKDKMKLTSVGEIDKQMKSILDKLNDDDTEPEEQKRLVTSIKQLAESKTIINNAKEKIQKLEQASAKSNDFGKELDKVNEEMEKAVKEEKELRKRINKVRQAEEEEVADIPALNEEKQACYEVIVECRNTIKQLQEDYNQEFEDYKQKMEEFKYEQDKIREEQQKQREERQQARQAEEKEKQVARKQRQIEIAGAPFSEEILRCDQLIAFLAKYDVPKQKESQATASTAAAPIAFEPGMKMIRRKNQMDDDEDDPLVGSLSRKANQKKKGKKNKVVAPEPKKLNLDMDLLMAFSQIKVTVPATPEEVPPILEEIKAKKTTYQEKQKKALDAITRGERYIDTEEVPKDISSKSEEQKDSKKVADDDSKANVDKNAEVTEDDEKKEEDDDDEEEEEAINESGYEESSRFQKQTDEKEDEPQHSVHDDVEKIMANTEDDDDIDINSSKFLKNVKKVENDEEDNDISQSKFLKSVETVEKKEEEKDEKHVENAQNVDDDDDDVENAPQNEIVQGEEVVEVGSQD